MRDTIIATSLLLLLQASSLNQGAAPPGYSTGLDTERAGGSLAVSTQREGSGQVGQWAVAIIGAPVYLAWQAAGDADPMVTVALADSPYAMGIDEHGNGVSADRRPNDI